MADNQFVMGIQPQAAPPWALAGVATRPGVRYGVLLFAIGAGLIGSAALLGHAVNAPSLAAFDRSGPCGVATSPDCRAMATSTIVDDRPLPLGIHAVTLLVGGRPTVYYGWADSSASGLPAASDAVLFVWRGRVVRVFSQGLTLEPFEGPPGAAFLLLATAIVSELLCGLALVLHGLLWRLRVRALPVLAERRGGRRLGPPGWVFVGTMAVVMLAGRTGHALIAASLQALCGAVLTALCLLAGVRSVRALVPVARRGMDALSEEPALGLGADVALAAVLVAVCVSLTSDLVVADLLSLPR